MTAEFTAGLIRDRTREGLAVDTAKGKLRGKHLQPLKAQESNLVSVQRPGTHPR
ncbi:hypothetical protein [Arthrobacter sp. SDTb3-6]|uniref:hypothetical protein n=1 Tax=Arthrobacter sp. SDTb3-6 TaxID=2713571 RepID=UPI00159D07FA|nr:hypothetical protein [Arthrobacter sp. SDTb3-6]NVM97614.1 hypothetical protein [Arthrobacter sp. SDTb3-6]